MDNNAEMDKISHIILKEELSHYDFLYKLIIIGDMGVGKSCLLLRASKDEFKEEHDVTIGVEFGSFSIKLADSAVKIQIWDTAGQETFKSVTKVFFKGSHCIFLVYDITKEETFENLESWLKEIRENAPANVSLVLVGNKVDLEEKRAISKEKALGFKSRENLDGFIETSAKSGSGVKELFVKTSKLLFTHHKDKGDTSKDPTQENDKPTRIITVNEIGKNPKKSKCKC